MSPEEDGKRINYNSPTRAECRKYEKTYGKTLRISRNDWQIVFCRNLEHEGIAALGLCSPELLTIYIDIDAENIEATLLHEIYHAEISTSGLRQRYDWDFNVEEQIVDILSEATVHLFKVKRRA